jgi:transketolase
MRKAFVDALSSALHSDEKLALFLGDIGVFGFREVLTKFPDRVFNFGILEQAMVSSAAGFSESGLHPIVSTIAPFIVNRAYEQIKIDFGYQKLAGTFISVGASFDYAPLGATHYCPEDLNLLSNVHGMRLFFPGNAVEASGVIKSCLKGGLSYVRLSEQSHGLPYEIYGTKQLNDSNSDMGVLFLGTSLRNFTSAISDANISVLYSNDFESLEAYDFSNFSVLTLVSDFFSDFIVARLAVKYPDLKLQQVAPKRSFYSDYGSYSDVASVMGFDLADVLRVLRT